MTALLFGSISTLADTSELQRESFNRAFAEHGLDWHWDVESYRAQLGRAGGRDRIAEYARARGEDVDAEAIHRTKSELFRRSLASAAPSPREGVLDTVRAARARGDRIALVTTTAPDNVRALLSALAPDLSTETFELVVDTTVVADPKPDPAAYRWALDELGVAADACVAVEDNPDGVRAAVAAGVACVAFPNQNTAGQDFPGAAARVDRLDLDDLRGLVRG